MVMNCGMLRLQWYMFRTLLYGVNATALGSLLYACWNFARLSPLLYMVISLL